MPDFDYEETTHKVEIIKRESIRLQGVLHVESFDENQILVETDAGMANMTGEDFHITSLDLERGLLVIEGMLTALEYSPLDRQRRLKEKGLWHRLFR